MFQAQTVDPNYRFVWINPEIENTQYGTYLFYDPSDAKAAQDALKKEFKDYVIWLEDRDHNRVEIPQ